MSSGCKRDDALMRPARQARHDGRGRPLQELPFHWQTFGPEILCDFDEVLGSLRFYLGVDLDEARVV